MGRYLLNTDMQQRLEILKQVDLFQSLTETELECFARDISEIQIEKESVLFSEGDIGRDMYILAKGSLLIFKKNRRITTISPPDYIGEMSIIEDKPRSATVIAAPGSKMFKITSEQFERYFAERPESLVSMIKTLSRRIRRDNELISAEFARANILIHDMRNTVSAFLLLDLLEKNCQDEKQLKYISLMQRSRRDLAEMMEEALANAKRMHFHKETCNNSLSTLIEELAASDFILHPDLEDKKVELDLCTDLPEFIFSRTDIHRVLANLAINAGQASKAGDLIRIKLSRTQDHAVVAITDQGSGIPEDIQKKIFLPHFTTREHSSGFGLSSCKEIIEEQHGGKLSYETKAGLGTTFTFTLPL